MAWSWLQRWIQSSVLLLSIINLVIWAPLSIWICDKCYSVLLFDRSADVPSNPLPVQAKCWLTWQVGGRRLCFEERRNTLWRKELVIKEDSTYLCATKTKCMLAYLSQWPIPFSMTHNTVKYAQNTTIQDMQIRTGTDLMWLLFMWTLPDI